MKMLAGANLPESACQPLKNSSPQTLATVLHLAWSLSPAASQDVHQAAQVMDPVGWTAMKLEWGALWWVAHDEKVPSSFHQLTWQN